MQLFHAPASPFVRKVMILVHEAGIAERVRLVAATGNAVSPQTMPLLHNPLGKIPALVLDDGRALYDSRVICRYLDDLAGSGFYPPAPALWDSLTREATADGIMEAAVLMIYEKRLRPAEMQFQPWIEGQWGKISRALDALEQQGAAPLSGPLEIGQIAVAAALGYLDFRLPDRPWRDSRPRLAAWFAAFSDRPSMRQTPPQG